MKKTNENEIIILSIVCFWIFVVNIAGAVLGLTGWPMYFVPIFFFIQGADVKKIPSIFIGATLGLAAAYFLVTGLHAFTPVIGLVPAFIILIAIVLAVIIVGGSVLPIACNNVAFGYLTACTINLESITFSSICNNILVLYIGGGIMLAGAIGASMIAKKLVSNAHE